MEFTFLGTRANIAQSNRRHRRHSVLLVEHRGRRVLIDCGGDWLHQQRRLRADALVLSHAYSDHVSGLRRGASCPVYATLATWKRINRYPIDDRRRLLIGKPANICGLWFEPFAVEHSIRAPAVGFRLNDGSTTVFYCPDLARMRRRHAALTGIAAYIGDGATISRPILKKHDGALIGHASIRTQLDWCRREAVRRAIFTHCGKAIVRMDEPAIRALVNQLSLEFGLAVEIAHDGLHFRTP